MKNQFKKKKHYSFLKTERVPIRILKSLFCAILYCSPVFLFAINNDTLEVDVQQKITIKGTVVDDQGVPFTGATIIQQGTSIGTIANFDGEFSLRIDYNSSIEISYIGYKTKVVKNIIDFSAINVKLELDMTSLNEVVIVGFGRQTKQTVVGAIASIKGAELTKAGSVSTISEALQGSIAGLTVINTSGKPGADAGDIYLRGRSSWQGDGGPLTLVDGIERDINNLDPNEIESITVLKDASATAVYGVRGANGVILVTTKRGKLGEAKFNFTANIGFKQSTAEPKFADYITAQNLYNVAAMNDNNFTQLIPDSTLDAWIENYDQRGPDNIYFPEVDWVDEVMGTGFEQTYNLNISGGSPLVRYFVSVGYRNDGDIFKTVANDEYDPAFGLQKYNWRSNFDFDVTSTTKLSVNFSGNFRERTQPGYRIDGGGEDGFGQSIFFNRLYGAPRNLYPITYEDGYGESTSGESNIYVTLNEGGQRTYKYFQGFYDLELTQGLDLITKGLSFKGSINYSSSSSYEQKILRVGLGSSDVGIIRYSRIYDYANPIVAPDGTVTYPLLSEVRFPDDLSQGSPVTSNTPSLFSYGRVLNYKFQFNYKRNFGDHFLGANAIMWRQINTYRNGLRQKREEWIGRVNYYYKKRYLVEVNGSYSGSEKFAPDKRFGFFPSIGLGWVASEEPFIKKIAGNWLDLLKVNYSYGITGDDGNVRFQYIQTYSTADNVNFGLDNLTGYGPRYTEGALPNDNSTWEESRVHNLSFKFEVLKKLDFALDLYKEKRTGILMDVRLPTYLGISDLATGNVGETKKHGYELQVGWKDNITDDLNYGVNFSTSFTENRVVFRNDLLYQADYLKQAGKPIGWSSRLIEAGLYQSLDDIYNATAPSLGVSQGNLVPGDAMYIDYNGDGIVSAADNVIMDKLEIPLRTHSLRLNLGYKNFALSALFYGVSDVSYIIPNNYYFDFNTYIQANQDVVNSWTPETAETAEKPALHLSNIHNKTASTLTYANGAYIRLKTAEFSYRFDKDMISMLRLDSALIYINGNNLYTWSYLDDQMDPENSGDGSYPIVKRVSLGVRVGF
ncbi:TonB-dependent receptor [Flavicella sp.]|uniref:SusC/RagA family TonB-linked outer membrane protein n=1 Tax=Flavicella sp. TaxID=2957742 RepID=UPI003016F838